MPLSEAFRLIRDHHGLTMRAFAARLGVSHVHVNDLEHGKVSPSIELLGRVREEYGFDPYLLMALKNEGDVEKYYRLLNNEAG